MKTKSANASVDQIIFSVRVLRNPQSITRPQSVFGMIIALPSLNVKRPGRSPRVESWILAESFNLNDKIGRPFEADFSLKSVYI